MVNCITKIAALLAALSLQAHALQITSLSPQGEVAQARQVVAKFDDSAVNFGDPKAPAPLALSCSDLQATKGSGRWTSDREWVFEFEADLPPGISCTLQLRSGLNRPQDQRLQAPPAITLIAAGILCQGYRI